MTPIQILTFKFMSNGGDLQSSGSSDTNVTLTAGNSVNSIILKGNKKGIQMNANGQGNLIVDYNNQTGKNFTLDLQDAPDGATSFAGHLKIANQGNSSSNSNTFTATLSHDLTGSVTLSGASGNNTIKLTHGSLRGNIGSGNASGSNNDNKLTIDFTNNKDGRVVGDIYTYNNDQQKMTITIKGGGLEGNIRIAGPNNGAPGTGDLIVNFEDGAVMVGNIGHSKMSEGNDYQKKEVIFKKATSGSLALKNNEDFVLTGNITSYGTGVASLDGKTDTTKGNHVTFEHGSMKGNISSGYDINGRRGYNQVTFQGENAKLVGQVRLTNNGRNEIHFEKGGAITGTIYTDTDGFAPNFNGYQTKVWNRITFDGTQNASISGNGNVISSNGRMNHIVFNGTGTNTITGNIFSKNFWQGNGNNTIIFNSNGTNTITGNIAANSGSNIIVFAPKSEMQGGALKLSESPKSNTINGTIQANDGGVNKIISTNATNAGSNSTGITNTIKNITAENGRNYITLGVDDTITETKVQGKAVVASQAIESTNNITGNILAGRNGFGSVNHIYLKGKNTIGATSADSARQTTDLSITAHNRDNDKTDKINYIKLEGSSTTINLKEIRAEGNADSSENKAKNLISLDGTTNTITLTNITGSKGSNYIGKNVLKTSDIRNDITLISDDTSTKKIKDAYTLQQKPDYKFLDPNNRASGKLTIKDEAWKSVISAIGWSAQNHIDFQEMDITGKIDANAGQNYINAEKLSLNGDIIARWGGKNYILVGKDTLKQELNGEPTLTTLKNTAIKAQDGNNTSENVILFKDSVKFENVSIIGNNGGRKNNFISVDGTNNDLVIDSMKLDASGKNYLVKGLVEYNTNGNKFIQITEPDMTSDKNAITGKLYIKNGISTAKDGANFISYKADATILATASMPEEEKKEEEVEVVAAANATASQNYIIGKLEEKESAKVLGTAVSGNNNLYLDLSQNKDFADAASVLAKLQGLIKQESSAGNQGFSLQDSFQSVIAGHITNNGGTNNIFIKGGKNAAQPEVMLEGAAGTAGEATTGVKLGLAGISLQMVVVIILSLKIVSGYLLQSLHLVITILHRFLLAAPNQEILQMIMVKPILF
ncbi:hypothetical protein LW135_06180 [Helicobacter sp. faydin-H20]|uniref:hypothetical protein n=1 Tax=Helicobacter anatolicus TaxID=2905874 RepID=UPI001E4E85BB|nr:hypothetical protein [Helicobacter anatolicus]MCE3037414.1 hypothetical protein [Helicobacter anatolicus]